MILIGEPNGQLATCSEVLLGQLRLSLKLPLQKGAGQSIKQKHNKK